MQYEYRRLRHRVGEPAAPAALHRYLRGRDSRPAELLKLASAPCPRARSACPRHCECRMKRPTRASQADSAYLDLQNRRRHHDSGGRGPSHATGYVNGQQSAIRRGRRRAISARSSKSQSPSRLEYGRQRVTASSGTSSPVPAKYPCRAMYDISSHSIGSLPILGGPMTGSSASESGSPRPCSTTRRPWAMSQPRKYSKPSSEHPRGSGKPRPTARSGRNLPAGPTRSAER